MRAKSLPISILMLSLAVFSAVWFAGCSGDADDRIVLCAVAGADQCAANPDGSFPVPLVVEARRGGRLCPGVRIECAAEPGSHLASAPAAGVTDSGGRFETRVVAGATGDQFLRVSAPDDPGSVLRVRFVNGVEVSGAGAAAPAGGTLKHPVAVRLVKNGRTVPGVPVRFTIRSSVEGADTSAYAETPRDVTDSLGRAATRVTLGKATGRYKLGIDVDGGDAGFAVRDLTVTLVALAPWSVIAAVLGGVALFIFGMGLMSDGLRAAAGDRLKGLLRLFTRNRLSGLFAGAVVTAALQSSAAVTVMVTGFINAGLLTLQIGRAHV